MKTPTAGTKLDDSSSPLEPIVPEPFKAPAQDGPSADGPIPDEPEGQIDRLVLQVLALRSIGSIEQAVEKCIEALELSEQRADLVELTLGVVQQSDDQHRTLDILAPLALKKNAPARIIRAFALALVKIGSLTEAVEQLKRVVIADPTDRESRLRIVKLLTNQGKSADAFEFLNATTKSLPNKHPFLIQCAALFADQGDQATAIKLVDLVNSGYTFSPEENMIVAGIRGTGFPARLPAEAAQRLFDHHAANFDSNLASLDYVGPELIARALQFTDLAVSESHRVLDAGCGTGLCGPVLKPYSAHLTGVDVSDEMLLKAKQRDCYDTLQNLDLEAIGSAYEQQFDLVVCADVFCYFGDLTIPLTNLYQSLSPGGYIVFTVESLENYEEFKLKPSGRYGHSAHYLRNLLPGVGFTKPLTEISETLRTQYDDPISGLVIAARRPL